MNKIICFTDGAATMTKVNGEYVRGAGGSAFAVVSEDLNEVYHSDSQHFDNTTNNHCELYAILMALKYCHENYSGRPIEVHSDSAYCVNMLKPDGWVYGWEKNGWTRGKKHEPIENLEIIQKIYRYLLNDDVTFVKIKGHSGNVGNELVDKLAVAAKNRNTFDNEEIK